MIDGGSIGFYRVYDIYDVKNKSEELNQRFKETGKMIGEGTLTKQEEEKIKKMLGD